MKVITLNIWGGRAGKEKVLSFLKNHASDTDVFCLQEVWGGPHKELEGVTAGGQHFDHDRIMVYGRQDITELLSDYVPYFHPQYGDQYGLLMLVHKKTRVMNDGEVFVHLYKGFKPPLEELGKHARNLQYVTIETENGPMMIVNFHGLWNGQGKGDSEDRLLQSDNIVSFFNTITTPIVFCGDFNLNPDTESVKKIEDSKLRNLVTEYGVISTRTSFYTKPEKYADYIFISDGLEVINFEVLPDEVSDHAPLMVEIRQ